MSFDPHAEAIAEDAALTQQDEKIEAIRDALHDFTSWLTKSGYKVVRTEQGVRMSDPDVVVFQSSIGLVNAFLEER